MVLFVSHHDPKLPGGSLVNLCILMAVQVAEMSLMILALQLKTHENKSQNDARLT